jgi:hypothetical protein
MSPGKEDKPGHGVANDATASALPDRSFGDEKLISHPIIENVADFRTRKRLPSISKSWYDAARVLDRRGPRGLPVLPGRRTFSFRYSWDNVSLLGIQEYFIHYLEGTVQ